MKITIFNSLPTKGKSPISPYGDKTFDFLTLDVESEYELLRILSQNFILNIPLKVDKIHTYRRVESLRSYIVDKVQYLILDLDKIKTQENQLKVLQYFKGWKCLIAESRSCNNVDNFNLKGFLFCDLSLLHLKYAVQQLHYDLIDLCDVDEAVSRRACLNAPILKYKVVYDNLQCPKILTFNDITVLPKQDKVLQGIKFNLKDLKDIKYTSYESIDDLCLQTFQFMGFQAISVNTDGSISFRHPKEKTPGGYFWYRDSPYLMHHFNKSKTINIWDYIRVNPLYKDLTRKAINYQEVLSDSTKNFDTLEVSSQYLDLTPEIEDSIKMFLERKNGLYMIKSPMGTGKSTIIKYIIDEALQVDMRILIITNRISVAEDFKNKYNLKLYNQDNYQIGDSLIVQYDSLYKYNIKNFDLCILDEFISLLFHSRSALNNSSINVAKFFASFNLKLVVADAFLTGYENKLLDKTDNCFKLVNTWRDSTPVFLYLHFNYFINNLVTCASKDKVTVSSTSLSVINSLQLLLTDLGFRVVTLTAETPQHTKQLIYGLFQKSQCDKWDVLLYSPTLTVGVSNLNQVKYHFHYDSAMTTDVISSLQMLKRTRKAQQVHIYVRSRVNYLKTEFQDLKDEYLNSIKDVVQYNYFFNVNDYGEPILNKIGKKSILIDAFKNTLEFNHKDAFLYLLKYHFKDDVQLVQNDALNKLEPYQKESKDNEKELLYQLVKQYLDLDGSEVEVTKDYDKLDYILKNFDTLYTLDKEVFKLCIQDKQFIKKCKYYKLLSMIINEKISIVDLQMWTSDAIVKNNLEDIDMFKAVRGIECIRLQDDFPSTINSSLKNYLLKAGYKVNKYKHLILDPNVKKYQEFIKIP